MLPTPQHQYPSRRVVQARLKELEEFGETEKFVTNAYKKKLLEWQKLDAEDARQAAIEAHNDPTRKGNLDSFYLNLMHDNGGLNTQSRMLTSFELRMAIVPAFTPSTEGA
eukprot:SAG11_NODE_112_length_16156_cov_22.455191_10_plen_110_part_00